MLLIALKTAYASALTDKLKSMVTMERIIWVIIGFGLLVRVAQFMSNASLWVDEAALAVSIIGRPYGGLLNTLEFHTGSPIGFLMLSKLSTQILGSGERALRLVALLSGIGSLFLLYALAKHYIRPYAVALALLMLATSTSVVRLTTFVKQYSSDMFFALLILLMQTYVMRSRLAYRWLIPYTLLGAATIWFSHPSVFVLAAMGGVMGTHYLLRREWAQVIKVAVMCSAWLVSFAASYKLTTVGNLATNDGLRSAFEYKSTFVPFPPYTLADIQWYATTLLGLLDVPVGLPLTGLAAFLLLLGGGALFVKDRYKFFILASPIAVTFLVSAAKLYPFADRWILFLVPLILMFVAEGAMSLHRMTKHVTPLISFAFIGLLLLHPISSEVLHLVHPRGSEEIRPVLEHVQSRRTEGDALYVYAGALKAFTYYVERLDMDENEYTLGGHYIINNSIAPQASDKWAALELYTSEIDEFKGNSQVWVVFSNIKTSRGVNEQEYLLHHLDGIGIQVETFRVNNAVAYLYDLSEPPASTS